MASKLPPDLSDLDPLNDPLFSSTRQNGQHGNGTSNNRKNGVSPLTAQSQSTSLLPARPASTDPLTLLMNDNSNKSLLPTAHAANQAVQAHETRHEHILNDLHSTPFAAAPAAAASRPMPLPQRRPSYSGTGFSPPRRLSGIMGEQHRQDSSSFSLDPSLSSPALEPFHPHSPTSTTALHSLEHEKRRKSPRRSSSADEWTDFHDAASAAPVTAHVPSLAWPTSPQRAFTFPFSRTTGKTVSEEPVPMPPDHASAVIEALHPIQLFGVRPGTVQILDEDIAEGVRPSLPPRVRTLHRWKLLYSLDAHGTSFTTLYDRMRHAWDGEGPILLVVKDVDGNRFGAYANERLHRNDGYYGDSSCFLFTTLPRPPGPQLGPIIRTWRSTLRNTYYVLSDYSAISFGGGDGQQGLWIDDKFEKGYTGRSITFGNDPLGVEHADRGRSFEVLAVEAWAIA